MRKLLACVPLLALAGCVLPLNASTAQHEFSPAGDPDAPQLALLEFRIEREYVRYGSARLLCAAVGRADAQQPLAEEDQQRLMIRFPALAPLSRCEMREGEYVDAITGEPAAVIELFDFTCDTATRCHGSAGFRYGANVAGFTIYDLEYAGYWRVREEPNNIVLTGDGA